MHNIIILVRLIILTTGGHTKTVYVTQNACLRFLHKMCSKRFIATKHILQVTANHTQDVSRNVRRSSHKMSTIFVQF
jgi:hypothetical protein